MSFRLANLVRSCECRLRTRSMVRSVAGPSHIYSCVPTSWNLGGRLCPREFSAGVDVARVSESLRCASRTRRVLDTFSTIRRSSGRGASAKMSTGIPASPAQTGQEAEKYFFGPWNIDAREVFFTSKHCFCFVNLRPVVPDVLVATKRLAPRFTELSAEEVADLWMTTQRVGKTLEPFFFGTSLTLAIQDGPEAGQTVPHVHVHVLPRKKADFKNNDEIYDELDKREKEFDDAKEEEKHLNLDEERRDRSREEMFEEASKLRALFQ